MDDIMQDMPGEGSDEESAVQAVQTNAHRQAGEHYFRGTKLNAFSVLRQTAAVCLRLRYARTTEDDWERYPNPAYDTLPAFKEELARLEAGEQSPEAIEQIGGLRENIKAIEAQDDEFYMYAEAPYDAMKVVWLCLQKDSTCHRVRRNPDEWESKIDQWAKAEGLSVFNPDPELMGEFFKIMQEVQVAKFKPEIKEGADEPKN